MSKASRDPHHPDNVVIDARTHELRSLAGYEYVRDLQAQRDELLTTLESIRRTHLGLLSRELAEQVKDAIAKAKG